MSLPPALLERLKRRRIIQEVDEKPERQKTAAETNLHDRYGYAETSKDNLIPESKEGEEEIIAADYSDESGSDGGNDQSDISDKSDTEQDDTNASHDQQSDMNQSKADDNELSNQTQEAQGQSHNQEMVAPVLGCPNKYNVYHECNQYCKENYGSPDSMDPSKEQRKQLALILRTLPMSNEWTVVYEPGVGTFYFWNIISNQVSWYPPGMGVPTSPSADYIRQLMRLNYSQQPQLDLD